MKFTQPVSMRVQNEEIFERDLEKQLEALGYSIIDLDMFKDYHILCTNCNGINNEVSNIYYNRRESHQRYYIDHYNPELFLALASMTDEQYGIAGEWWVCLSQNANFTKGKLYKCLKPIYQMSAFIDDVGNENGFLDSMLKHFRKATKEELIAHFTQQDNKEQKQVEEPSKSQFNEVLGNISKLLEHKNKNYGNSALEPLQIFGNKCKVGTRLDDKLARIKNSQELRKNDLTDVVGYCVLALIEKGWTSFDELMD